MERIVIRVDYSNYLDQQNQWAGSLVRLAKRADPVQARELGEIAATILRRMLDFALKRRYRRDAAGR